MTRARASRGGTTAPTGATGRDEESADVGLLTEALGARMGVDLSGVRIHTDGAAARSADALDARAYTVGQDVHFGAGELDPATRSGRKLLAHELVHTVQARGAGPSLATKRRTSDPGDAAEREADRAADALIDGSGPVAVREAPSAIVHRDAKGRSAGEPVIDKLEPEPEVTPIGHSGLPQTEIATGKLIYPLGAKDVPGVNAKKLNHDTKELMDDVAATDRQFLKLKERYGEDEEFQAMAYRAGYMRIEHAEGEIEENVDNTVAEQGKQMHDAGTDLATINALLGHIKGAFDDAGRALHIAHKEYAAAKDRIKVKELDKKIAEVEHWAGIIGDGIKAVAKVVTNPEAALEQAADFIVDRALEIATDIVTEDLKGERDRASEDALEQDLGAAEESEALAEAQIARAGREIGELEGLVTGVGVTYERRRDNAERVYDKRTGGTFKFEQLRATIERADDYVMRADTAIDFTGMVLRYADKVQAGVAEIPFLEHAPEVMESHTALAMTRIRALQERKEMDAIKRRCEAVLEEANQKRAALDETLRDASERHDSSAELDAPAKKKTTGKKG